MFIWKKNIAPGSQGADGLAQVTARVGASRVAIIAPVDGRKARVELYCKLESEALALARAFGGRVRALADERWQPSPAAARGRPITIGGRLLVTAWPEERARLEHANPGKQVLCVPAAMAFGTGEHATTAMCLRLLLEAGARRRDAGWELLDLGTGSGILALAGSLLGARYACGLDHDAQAVRTAKENARLNGVPARAVRFARADLLRWKEPSGKRWPVITANLFSDLLVRLLPGVIAPLLTEDGDLILSGVLAEQENEVKRAIEAAGLQLVQVKSRGKWRAFRAQSAAWAAL